MEVVLLQEIPQEQVEQERKRRERQKGLAWPDWQARKRRSWHSRVVLSKAGLSLPSPPWQVTGKRHREEEGLLPPRLCPG